MQLAEMWLSQLPRSGDGDEEEACSVHEDLVYCVENVERYLPVVGGAQGAHMERILAIFGEIVARDQQGSTVVTPPTLQRINALLQQYQQQQQQK